MGLSRTRLHELINGKTAGGPETFPVRSLEIVCSIFDVDRKLMECPDFDEFERLLEERPRQAWTRLLEDAPETPDLEIIASRTKGVTDPDEINGHGLPEFPIGSGIMFNCNQRGRWHLLLALWDAGGWTCLRPSPHFPDTEFEGTYVFPHQPDEKRARFAPIGLPAGVHHLVAVLTDTRLPDADGAGLFSTSAATPSAGATPKTPQAPAAVLQSLDRVASSLKQKYARNPDGYRLMSRRFYVVPA